jgi:hypothetical protein
MGSLGLGLGGGRWFLSSCCLLCDIKSASDKTHARPIGCPPSSFTFSFLSCCANMLGKPHRERSSERHCIYATLRTCLV